MTIFSMQLRIGARLCKEGVKHPFMQDDASSEAFPSWLIGQEILKIIENIDVDRQILRVTSNDLRNKLSP